MFLLVSSFFFDHVLLQKISAIRQSMCSPFIISVFVIHRPLLPPSPSPRLIRVQPIWPFLGTPRGLIAHKWHYCLFNPISVPPPPCPAKTYGCKYSRQCLSISSASPPASYDACGSSASHSPPQDYLVRLSRCPLTKDIWFPPLMPPSFRISWMHHKDVAAHDF